MNQLRMKRLVPTGWSVNQWLAVLGLIVALMTVNYSVFQKEHVLANGEQVLLELAPVDPRSLMQGDYMALRFELEGDIYNALPEPDSGAFWKEGIDSADGRIVVALDEDQVAQFVGLYSGQVLLENQRLLQYRIRNGAVKFASNAFFFEEGKGERFEFARYGAFQVADDGELLLTAMYDQNRHLITYDSPKP